MSRNLTLPSIIVLLTLGSIAACEPTGTDDDQAVRPSYDRESPDRRTAPERVPDQDPQDPKAGESVTERPPAEDDVSDMP